MAPVPRSLAPRVVAVLIVGAALVALACARVVWAGEAELAESTRALRAKDPDAAIAHARRAASWSLPGARHVGAARERLRALAREAEARKRLDLALFAWRGLRQAEIETRWWWSTKSADRDLAEREIARLAAASERPVAERTLPADAVERWHLEALSRETLPSRAWIPFLVGAAGLWVGLVALAGRRAANLSSGRDLLALGGVGLGLALSLGVWIVSLLRA